LDSIRRHAYGKLRAPYVIGIYCTGWGVGADHGRFCDALLGYEFKTCLVRGWIATITNYINYCH